MTTTLAERPARRTCDGPTCQVTISFEGANAAWITLGENRGTTRYPDWELLFHDHPCASAWAAANPVRYQELWEAWP